MTDNEDVLVKNEIAMMESDKITIREEIERSKRIMAEQLKSEMKNVSEIYVPSYYYSPIRYRKPFKVKLRDFIEKVKLVFFRRDGD